MTQFLFKKDFRRLLGLLLITLVTAVGLISSPCLSKEPEDKVWDLVFDLDWTLVYTTNEAMASADNRGIIRLSSDKKVYRYSDYAIDVLIELHSHPEFRISYFSGGSQERNHELIDEIYAEIDRRVGHSRFRPYKKLDVEEMDQVSDGPQLRFRERYKKDLSPYFDLHNTLLIDDVKEFASADQEMNILWVGPTFEDRPSYQLRHLENAHRRQFSAPSFSEWAKEREKILRVTGLIHEARKRWARYGRVHSLGAMMKTVLVDEQAGTLRPERLGRFLIERRACEVELTLCL